MIVYLEILIIGWLKSSANDRFDCKPKRKFHMDMQEPFSSQYFITLKKDINAMFFKSTSNIKWKIICITLKDKISTLFNSRIFILTCKSSMTHFIKNISRKTFSRGSSQPRARTQVSRIVDRCFTVWTTREVQDTACMHRKKKKAESKFLSAWT